MTETLIPLHDVPDLAWLPRRRNGVKLAGVTLWRWSTAGLRGIRLRTVRVGVTPCTTEEWLREFFEALAQPARTPNIRTPARRGRDIDAAQARLAAAGI